MPQRGRKPKPTALKILEGNPGRRPLNENEPQFPTDGVECPEWMSVEGRQEWARVAPMLRSMGLLTAADTMALAGYCQAYARWREAEDFISVHGSVVRTPSGYVQQVPQVSIAQTNLKIMKDFMSEFGMTPASRSRLNIETAQIPQTDSDSMMMQLLGGMGA